MAARYEQDPRGCQIGGRAGVLPRHAGPSNPAREGSAETDPSCGDCAANPSGIRASIRGVPPAGRFPVFDAHVDSLQRALDLGHDLGRRGPGHLDLVRAAEGGVTSLVLVCWVDPATVDRAASGARARALLREAHRLAERHPDRVALVGNAAELRAAHAAGKIAGIPGIEGGHAIEEDLANLRWFFEHGLRVMTLVWNNHLPWIRSCQDGAGPEVPDGLSDFGREVVREMNRLGMVVDLSHAGEQSFHDALEVTRAPVIASHSGCRALHDHPRNLTDDQLRALAANDGVVGIVFHPGFLDAEARAEEARVRESDAYRRIEGANETERMLLQSELMAARARPLAAERLVDHLLHAVEVAGVRHVGLGSDYDGIQRGPRGLDDASCYGRLADLLLERGLGESDVRRVFATNMERVFERVTGEGSLAYSAAVVAHLG
jgi:membrane dipeptidase